MKTYQISISAADLPYVMEAITLRAMTLHQSIQNQIIALEEEDRKRQDEARRAALPDPFDEPIVPKELLPAAQIKHAEDLEKHVISDVDKATEKKAPVSRKYKRAMLMRVLKSKNAADLSTAEIARRAGVSYVTAHKARAAFKKGKK